MRFAFAISLLVLCAHRLEGAVDYSRDILPILSDNCYHCHGPDEKGRKAKLRLDTKEGALGQRKDGSLIVVPGRSGDSELIRRVVTTNLDDKMPPPDSNRRLTAQQEKLLATWVDEGANWGIHWAFIPPAVKSAPATAAPREYNPIDRFVHLRLKEKGLAMSEEATKETLLRRITLDLTGLPPTLKELDAFLTDRSTNAWDRVIDRLMASPRFGERMASEWLDVARYADTHGYQMDRFRPMWPYRDWVIKAFNQNLPFNEFVKWQLAGDLLPNATKEQRLATAFNRLHNQNEEGGIVEEEYRVAYVADRVNTFGTAFLGLTTECARCHDHKYDPISQKEFYSLFAFFQNIDEAGQTSYFTDSMPVPTLLLSTDEQDAQLARLQRMIAGKERAIAVLKDSSTASFRAWLQTRTNHGTKGLVGDYRFDEIISNKVANLAGTNSARGHDNPRLVAGRHGQAVALSGENGFTFPGVGHFSRADAFSIALWLRTATHAERLVVLHHSKAPVDAGSRGYELLLEGGRVAFGLHHMWPRNSLKVAGAAPIPTNEWVHVTVTYDGSSRAAGVKLFVNGSATTQETIRDGLFKEISYGGGEPDLAIGYRFRDNGFKEGAVDDLRIFDRALTTLEVAELAGEPVEEAWQAPAQQLKPDQLAALQEYFHARISKETISLAAELQALRREQATLINPIPEVMVMEEMPQPKPARVLKRGAYDAPGEAVTADTPKALPPFPQQAPRNRLGLAQWLLQPDQPLMARVTVNRAWQMMFGRGIVETSDNFGSQGAQPSHPELLDWLAHEFVYTGWDMKRLLKLIATSATYRQSSKVSPDLLERDPHNELLARGPSHRLTAEMIRDQALALSGLIVEKIGGPSVKPYQPDGLWEIAMGRPKYDRGRGEDLYRRSLYTYWKRTVPPPAMVTFDAADRSWCTVKRQSTSTPLQALALLNDVQLVEAARLLGERMLKEGGASLDEQVSWIFRTAGLRQPSEQEAAILKALYHEQHEYFAQDEAAAKQFLTFGEAKSDATLPAPRLAAAAVVAQALLNHDASLWKR